MRECRVCGGRAWFLTREGVLAEHKEVLASGASRRCAGSGRPPKPDLSKPQAKCPRCELSAAGLPDAVKRVRRATACPRCGFDAWIPKFVVDTSPEAMQEFERKLFGAPVERKGAETTKET